MNICYFTVSFCFNSFHAYSCVVISCPEHLAKCWKQKTIKKIALKFPHLLRFSLSFSFKEREQRRQDKKCKERVIRSAHTSFSKVFTLNLQLFKLYGVLHSCSLSPFMVLLLSSVVCSSLLFSLDLFCANTLKNKRHKETSERQCKNEILYLHE